MANKSIALTIAITLLSVLILGKVSAFQTNPSSSFPSALFPSMSMYGGECEVMPSLRYGRSTFSSIPPPFSAGSVIKAFLDEDNWQPRVYSISSTGSSVRSDIRTQRNRPSFNIDYIQKENGDLEITADLPGYDTDDIEIELTSDNELKISVSKDTKEESKVGYSSGAKKEKSIDTDDSVIDLDAVDATLTEQETRKEIEDSKRDQNVTTQTIYRERVLLYGSRTIELPKDIDDSSISASLSKGVLTVKVPQLPAKKPHKRTISIVS